MILLQMHLFRLVQDWTDPYKTLILHGQRPMLVETACNPFDECTCETLDLSTLETYRDQL